MIEAIKPVTPSRVPGTPMRRGAFTPLNCWMISITIIFGVVTIILQGCAASRGFMAGAIGGPMAVDEYTHGEFIKGSFHSEFKPFAHGTLAIAIAAFAWPVAVTYAGCSGLYGAYQFHTYEKKLKTEVK